MKRIDPERLPALWWLNPWATARELHSCLVAMKLMSDMDDRVIAVLRRELTASRSELARLNRGLDELERIFREAPEGSERPGGGEGQG